MSSTRESSSPAESEDNRPLWQIEMCVHGQLRSPTPCFAAATSADDHLT